jgi:hypothetical protein
VLQNVHSLRHIFFNLNRELVDDVLDLIVTGRRRAPGCQYSCLQNSHQHSMYSRKSGAMRWWMMCWT